MHELVIIHEDITSGSGERINPQGWGDLRLVYMQYRQI